MVRDIYMVIGGSGFLGRHIVEMLVARGDSVCVFDIVQRYHDVPFYSGDLTDQNSVEEALRKSGTTCIIHTASPPHGLQPPIYWKVNVEGTETIIAAAVANKVGKLVYTSSAGVVYDGNDLVNIDERLDYPEQPFDAYNETKAKAEEIVLKANGEGGLLTVALRPSGIFGPGDRQAMHGFTQVLKNKQTHWQIGDNTNLFDWTYVGNVARAHLLAADKLSNPDPDVHVKVAQRPLPSIELTTGSRVLPTSLARPMGPAVDPDADAEKREAAFRNGGTVEERPIARSRFDQFSEKSLETAESDPLRVDGQAFFITNGEPLYFWDFARAVWFEMGDRTTKLWKLPAGVGLQLATAAEWWSWLVGKEPTFTRYRVTYSCTSRWYNIEKARQVLGYEPEVSVLDGIKRMVDWYKKEQNISG
ncbi:C-3 sterol dehydrogenase [Rickenella mellea]|uniref:C-3 sterol dehydrogenase n=1 Tax=Rickenella mellea TaxID=50990 RepID=A0A4Y7Q5R0_9AGAM|nr:C-3 sterol dehydrogenase [Rickenella mellea]